MTHDVTGTDPVLPDTYLAKCFREMMDRLSRASQPPVPNTDSVTRIGLRSFLQ